MLQIYTNQPIITGLTMQNVQPAGLRDDFVSAHIRAYAIRPYTCSVIIVDEYG